MALSPRLRTQLLTGLATTACAGLGTLAADPESAYYRGLDKPSWTPPKPAFPILWTSLYADLSVTSGSVISDLEDAGERQAADAYRRAFGLNLVLNVVWGWLFWRSRRPVLAAVGAGALAASGADLTRRAAQAGPGRAAALAPYAVWCAVATALSTSVARRNR